MFQHQASVELSLKPLRRPFDANAPTAQLVFFLHPGYADNQNILLTLPAFDSGGIHHGTAHTACAILANCRWDGFLSLSRTGARLSAGPDDVLPHGRYYFCIEGEDQYPVVPTFEHFHCPASLPHLYSCAPIVTSSADDAIRRDGSCRITAMFLYTANPGRGLDTRCADNTILLRRDLHKLWDDNKFVIVPKRGKWVVHVMWNSSVVDIQERYHNLQLQPLASVSRHFFLCRFALTVFFNSPFLGQRVTRKLVLVDPEGSTEFRVRDMTADEYRRKFSGSARANSGSQSPKKRQRSVPGNEVDDGSAPEQSEDSDDGNVEERRGRTRKRKWATEAARDSSFFEGLKDKNLAATGDPSPSLRWKRRRPSDGIDRLQTPPGST
ncbi:hypothetical protein P170DRAFT_481279 [Aspergillus steynii IBT 23096]|uniref:HNH nuclease domain-containing protein n=1 Tax=Aspergillus steynii IBT 23096 TaxID=1392250 RepID=A0A2I2FRT6_9EURO|nr:uncharacterized protein P170DRAFT_481279 [Aspergillus steynii IBT 23096]PLB43331.1 hypothetical protein P170DRAFT_481279 [Aspergillus steynii IBT 23096]